MLLSIFTVPILSGALSVILLALLELAQLPLDVCILVIDDPEEVLGCDFLSLWIYIPEALAVFGLPRDIMMTLRRGLIHLFQELLSVFRLLESRSRSRPTSAAVPSFLTLVDLLLLNLAPTSPVLDLIMVTVRDGFIIIVQLQLQVQFLLSNEIVHLGQRIAVVAQVFLIIIRLLLFQEVGISFRAVVHRWVQGSVFRILIS